MIPSLPRSLILAAVLVGAACGKPEPDPKPSTPTNWSLRQSLIKGDAIAPQYLDKLTDDFASKINGMNEAEAKSCRVQTYRSSLHFKNSAEDSFDGDFRQADRNKGEAARLSMAYEAFHRIVRQREKEAELAKLENSSSSIRRQVLAQGEFYTSPVPLANCRFEGIPHDDIALPYFNIYCEDAETGAERLAQEEEYAKIEAFCARLQSEYLDHGELDGVIMSESPLR